MLLFIEGKTHCYGTYYIFKYISCYYLSGRYPFFATMLYIQIHLMLLFIEQEGV